MTIGNKEVSGGHLALLSLAGIFLAGVAGLLLVVLWKSISLGWVSTFGIFLPGEVPNLLEREEAREEIFEQNNEARGF